MKNQLLSQVVRVYIGEQDQFHGGPLYAAIVGKFREIGIAGVTVFHGVEGYGSHGQLHTTRFENFFQGLPIVIEAVDIPDRVARALLVLDELIVDGLVTVHDVSATRYIKDQKPDH
jgi:uncharacterized protein